MHRLQCTSRRSLVCNHAKGVYIINPAGIVYHQPVRAVYHQGEALYIITPKACISPSPSRLSPCHLPLHKGGFLLSTVSAFCLSAIAKHYVFSISVTFSAVGTGVLDSPFWLSCFGASAKHYVFSKSEGLQIGSLREGAVTEGD